MIWVPFWWRWRQPKLRFGCCCATFAFICPFCFAKYGLCGFDYRKKTDPNRKTIQICYGGDGVNRSFASAVAAQPSHLYVHFASQNMDYAVSITEKKQTQIEKRFRSVMVEMAVIETASENQFPRISTSVVYLLRFPSRSADKQAFLYGIL